MYNVGYGGYNWASTIPAGSTYAHALNFHCGGIYLNHSNTRANGFQLRCLQE
ncbi:MAG: hypothetical protein K2K83_04340 [Rikenella sp.]|nr:hypothetical protein [Rikenella sp.]